MPDTNNHLSASAQKVQDALSALGFGACEVVEMPASTRTSADAAAAIGCTVGQIAKSLVFMGKTSGHPVLIIASGSNRVNTGRFKALLGEGLSKPDADYVRERTGFVIGGVPPVGHSTPLKTFIDQDLLQYEVIWSAAGTPRAVFKLTPGDLVRMTGGQVIDVT
ncbi:MAG: YbaK/EbsC family protein [Anaerolineae bacterium]|jgi:prolyl-tRNA editing enzyme YbaK/EbsC (Cys-tRNA(Pro) deacylase)|nr:YbaK/EbsC family protein [Anaerolineae bacterium]